MTGKRFIGVLVTLVGVLLGVPGAMAQDEPAERGERPQRFEPDPARLKSMLERRLASIEAQKARLREIIERLDAGESPAAIFAELRERSELDLLGALGDRMREGQRPPRGPAARGERMRNPDAISDEDFTLWRNRIMAFFEEHAPEMAERLQKAGDSDESRRAVLRLRREVERLIELRERNAEEFRPALERLRNGVRIADILGRVRRAALDGSLTEDQLDAVREELTGIVARQYDAQLAARRSFLERTSRRLEHARETFERERADRDERIAREVRAMLERATRVGEEAPGRPGRR